MRDFVTFHLKAAENDKKYLFECKDSKEESGYKLKVTLDASHSGIVNGNLRWYRPDRMAQGMHTWTPEGRIPAPVLINHDRGGPCVGRVLGGNYVDLSSQYLSLPKFKDNIFCDAASGPGKKMDLFKSIDWIYDNLQENDANYQGLGVMRLGVKVTDPKSIRKVQDEEYIGVSISFATDSGICSICHTDWAKDAQCEHKMGRRYNDKLAFLIAGKFINKEVSFVNFPADAFGRVKSSELMDHLKDADTRMFFLGLPLAKQYDLSGDSTEISDSLLLSDIELVAEAEMDDNMTLQDLLNEVKAGELDKDSALSLREKFSSLGDSLNASDKRRVSRALTTLDSLIRKNNWEGDQLTKEQVQERISSVDTHLASLSDASEKASYLEQLETDAKIFGLDFKAPVTETEVEDTTSAAAATTGGTSFVPEIVAGVELFDSDKGKSFVTALSGLEAAFSELLTADENVYTATEAVYTLWNKLTSGRQLEYLKRFMAKDEDSKDMIVDRSEYNELHDELTGLNEEVKKLSGDNKVLAGANRILLSDQKKTLARVLVMGRRVSGDTRLASMSVEEIDAEVERLSHRQIASLSDSVNDLFAGNTVIKVEDQTNSTAAETAREIKDTTSVEVNDQPGERVSQSDAEHSDGSSEHPVVLPFRGNDLRKIRAMSRHRQLKTE